MDPEPPVGLDLSLDLVVLDADRPVFELRGLGLKRITSGQPGAGRSLVSKVQWVKRSLIGQGERERQHVLVAHASPGTAEALAGLAGPGCTVSRAADPEGVAAILGAGQVTDVCWFWRPGAAAPADLAALRAECERNYRDLLAVLGVLTEQGFGRNQRLWLVTEQAQWLAGDEPAEDRPSAAATLWGFGHSLLNEYPAYRTTMVDLPEGQAALGYLTEEWAARSTHDYQVAYRDGHRHVRRLIPIDAADRDADGNFRLAITEYGQFSNIRAIAADDVPPGEGEIQVRVAAAGRTSRTCLTPWA